MSEPSKKNPDTLYEEMMERAFFYLGRYAASRARLARYLRKRFRELPEAELEEALPRVLRRVEELGIIDDREYASRRIEGLRARGKSRRAIERDLYEKGIDRELAAELLRSSSAEDERLSALIFIRSRRLGAFRRRERGFDKELAALGRAGFSYAIAREVLELSLEDAERAIEEAR